MTHHNINPTLARAARTMLYAAPDVESEAMDWYRLILDAELFRARTGWGLAGTWGHIHRGEYEQARASLDAMIDDVGDTDTDTVVIP